MPQTCDRFWADFDGDASPELLAHTAGCAECAEVLEAMVSPAGEDAPLPVPHALADAARAELVARPNVHRWWIAPVAVAELCLGIVLFKSLPHAATLAPAFGGFGLPLAALLFLAFGTAFFVATAPGLGRWASFALGGIGLGVAVMLARCTGWTHWMAPSGEACAIAEVVSSALPLAFAVGVLRQSAFTWSKTLAGVAACGGVGLLVLELGCPSNAWMHVLGAHVLPWIATCALAAFVRSRLPSTSYAP